MVLVSMRGGVTCINRLIELSELCTEILAREPQWRTRGLLGAFRNSAYALPALELSQGWNQGERGTSDTFHLRCVSEIYSLMREHVV